MENRNGQQELARFDTRLPLEQKLLFERAAALGGYRNLTDFILHSVQDKAREIIAESEQIIVSQEDGQIFFEAITNPPQPNTQLKSAAAHYKSKYLNE